MSDDNESPIDTGGPVLPAFVIGIGGCPSSGKRTLANALVEIFGPFVDKPLEG